MSELEVLVKIWNEFERTVTIYRNNYEKIVAGVTETCGKFDGMRKFQNALREPRMQGAKEFVQVYEQVYCR